MMRAWIEVPGDLAGWGALRILRGRLEDDGYHAEEYRLARGVMIQVTGTETRELGSPPEWRGERSPGI